MVHKRAENQRREGLSDVQPGIDNTVDPARRVLRRRALDQQVARRPGDSAGKTHQAEQYRHHPRRQGAQRQQQCDRRSQAKSRADNALAARRIGGQKTAQYHTAGAAHHVGRQANRHHRQRNVVQLSSGFGRERLHHAEHNGKPEEKGKAHPHCGNLQKVQSVPGDNVSRGWRLDCKRQLVAIDEQHDQYGKHQNARYRQRDAPRIRHGQRHHQRRRQRPAQATCDAVHAVGMAEPRRADLAVEQRVVGRVKDAVADAPDDGETGQHPVAGADRVTECRNAEQRQPAEKNRPWAEAVDDETRQRLHRTGDDEENRHQKAQLGIADVKLFLQPGKKRRQQQLAEMAERMGQADQSDDTGIAAQRRAAGGRVQGA